jgi:hypothetical protein
MSLRRVLKSGIQVGTSPKSSRSLQDSSGLPGTVQSLSGSVISNTQINLSWSAPLIVGDSSLTNYVVSSSPSGGSASISGTTAIVTGLTQNTSYTFTVRAQNSTGIGASNTLSPLTTFNFNEASGGTVTTISNYNGSGETWKVHSFTSPGTLAVSSNGDNFRVLVLGGGAGGCGIYAGGPSGGGFYTANDSQSLTISSHSVSIGGGGSGYCCEGPPADSGHGTSGGSSSLGAISGSGGVHHTASPAPRPFSSNISGTSTAYAPNSDGSVGYTPAPTERGAAGLRSGIHPSGGPNFPSGPGVAGIVVASYRVA